MATVIDNVNSQIAGSFSMSGVLNAVGWIIAGIIIIAIAGYAYFYWYNKKLFDTRITDFEVVGSHFEPSRRDLAKKVKLGSGGFEVLYLRKLKTYRLAYGGRVGRKDYYFFIDGDGYPYNSMLNAKIEYIDKYGGLVPVVTSNPTMRAQYTALEKQIESLHGEKKSFMDKYGAWVFAGSILLIGMIFLWLIYKEQAASMGHFNEVTKQMTTLTKQLTELSANIDTKSAGDSLVKVQ